ncbi:MAG: PorV/PorQ family protein [Bacteroidales bacterium]|nr:PorV/PorQ family protein [Bacteroidales bacterium]MDD4216225.1 PorV/PorQ family protein [Bacteroidales bacterium]MDY0141383.1 PorV/PorQ family protein [Bacteroidales bacterium]
MKNLYLISAILITVAMSLTSTKTFAGNEQRVGSNGASELLINPWARSSGWGDANVACVVGLEAMHQNIAGLAFTRKTEFAFTNTQWLVGSEVAINSGGFAAKVGETGVLGVSVMNMNWGKIDITTADLPEGGIGTFSPTYNIIGLGYAREFSNSIYGGITVKMLNQNIFNVSSSGFAIDAGIQYVTGLGKDKAGNRNRDNMRFGITMKNVGTTMKYSGDGMSFTGFSENGTSMTIEHRSQEFELPSLIKIGFSYHFRLAPKVDEVREEVTSDHNLIVAANYTSNSFTKDQYHLGIEYGFKEYLFLRGGFIYEDGIFDVATRSTALTGPTAGLTLQVPINKEKKSVLAIDYSYRFTNPFGGIHTFGARVTLGGGAGDSGSSRL